MPVRRPGNAVHPTNDGMAQPSVTFSEVTNFQPSRQQPSENVRTIEGRMSEYGDQASVNGEDEDISHEQLQMIKARTMFQMTEEISDDQGGGRKRLLFLTNSQAELLASNTASLQKMLDALEIPRPKLVINLLTSQGFSDFVTTFLYGDEADFSDEDAGLLRNRAPFLELEEEMRSIDQLDHFMATVLLPLAAQTNAIIFCSAVPANCVLSGSLTRMLSVHRSTWGKDPPFTVLSVSAGVPLLYQNPDESAVWRSIRRSSRAWRQRDRKLLELVWAKFNNQVPVCGTDLDPNAMIYLLVDTIHPKKERLNERGPFNKLMNELLRYLATTLPSLTIKTGHSDKPVLEKASQHASSLAIGMEGMLSGSPLLFLDLRERPLIEAADRQALIDKAKKMYEASCDALLQRGLAETMDAMTISYFHEVLFGDGDVTTTDTHSHAGRQCPLYEAIKRAEEGRGATFSGKLAPATVQQVSEVSLWMATKFFSDAWQVLPESTRARLAEHGVTDFAVHYKENISAMSVHIRTIISCRNFHHLNLSNFDGGAAKLVGELVKLDRLPNETTLQGLLLLRGAWCEYDVAMHLASRYKFRSKLIFLTQLFVAWGMVIVGISRSAERHYEVPQTRPPVPARPPTRHPCPHNSPS